MDQEKKEYIAERIVNIRKHTEQIQLWLHEIEEATATDDEE